MVSAFYSKASSSHYRISKGDIDIRAQLHACVAIVAVEALALCAVCRANDTVAKVAVARLAGVLEQGVEVLAAVPIVARAALAVVRVAAITDHALRVDGARVAAAPHRPRADVASVAAAVRPTSVTGPLPRVA